MKFNYGRIFLLGLGFFSVSVIWTVYNAFVPLFLADKFHLTPILIGFFIVDTWRQSRRSRNCISGSCGCVSA